VRSSGRSTHFAVETFDLRLAPLPDGHPFVLTPGFYWTMTPVNILPSLWYTVNLPNGSVFMLDKNFSSPVWCVRAAGGVNVLPAQ
jgi:hypothetical protein